MSNWLPTILGLVAGSCTTFGYVPQVLKIRREGDIDNRLKTLLDSFTMPDQNQTPDGSPDTGETPFFCLLEDDKLITGLAVKTDRLLRDAR